MRAVIAAIGPEDPAALRILFQNVLKLHLMLCRTLHFILTAVIGWWAFIMAMPDNIFATSISFRAFAALAPASVWAVFFGVSAFVGLIGLALEDRRVIAVSVAVLGSAHMAVALFVLKSGVPSTGIGAYGGWGIMAYYLIFVIMAHKKWNLPFTVRAMFAPVPTLDG